MHFGGRIASLPCTCLDRVGDTPTCNKR